MKNSDESATQQAQQVADERDTHPEVSAVGAITNGGYSHKSKSKENVRLKRLGSTAEDRFERGGGSQLTPDELRLQRYKNMLRRAGFPTDEHVLRLERMQKNQGADAMKLGVVSGQLYKDIFNRRAFDEFNFQVPPPKSPLELISEVARKILSKDSSGDDGRHKKEGEDAKTEARRKRIGYKPQVFGPPGLAPPRNKILNSEDREKYFSYEGSWIDGRMHGYGTYRFADGMVYEGVMRNNWPCGEGTAQYRNGTVYEGGWNDGKYEGYGKLTFPAGTVYEGSWHDGRRHGKGSLVYKSGSRYDGDFMLGFFHGRGRFTSANLRVTYDGWWNSGFICGHGTLTLPDGRTMVRKWPAESRYGGGLSLRGAVEMVRLEEEEARLQRLDEKQALYRVADAVELNFRVRNFRRELADRRAAEKAAQRNESTARKRAARLALMEAKMKALREEEVVEEPDPLEKEFL